MYYDFSVLSGSEFERLVDKLLIGKTRVIEQYAEGRDGGVDGLVCDIPKNTLIQSKHYLKSGFSQLKNKIIKEELPKLRNKNISCYVLATSLDLSRNQAEMLRDVIKREIPEVVVLGASSISSLLDMDPAALKSTDKLWIRNAEIVRAVLRPADMNSFYELRNRWEELSKVFVVTPDVKNVVSSLEVNHVAVIAGEPGVGKTTLAEYICLLYYKEGYEVHFFEGEFSRDDYDMSDTEKKVIFYFDDFLGSTYYNCFSGRQDATIVEFLKRISKEKNKRFILTSRTNIIQKASLYSQKYKDYRLANQAYIINVGSYSNSIKAKILYNHLRNSNVGANEIANFVKQKIYQTIISHRNFNPRLIHFITRRENFEDSQQGSYLEFISNSLDNPKEIWEKCFTVHLNSSQRLLVQLVVANGGKIQEKELKVAYCKALVLMDVKTPEQERSDFEYVLNVCLKSILRRDIEVSHNSRNAIISVFNPSVSDYVLPTILDRDVIAKLCGVLGTVGSIRVLESNEEKIVDVKSIYRRLLNGYSKTEWTDAKIRLIRLLGYECGLFPDLIKMALKDDCLVSDDNKFDFSDIVMDNLSKYDFSDFIMCYPFFICESYQEFGSLLDGYQASPFAKDYVIEFLQECLYELLEDNIESILVNETDAFICTSCEDVEEELKNFLEEIRESYPFLNDKNIDDIRKQVNFKRIVKENLKFFDSAKRSGRGEKKQKNEKNIDALFSRLL